MVFLTTPDNPSGFAPSIEECSICTATFRNCLLVVDEAYMDFAVPQERYSILSLAGSVPISWSADILKTLWSGRVASGIWRHAGEAGRLLATGETSFSVNVLAEAAGIAALDDDVFRSETIHTVVRGREMLTHALGEMGFLVYPSQANFILVKPPIAASELFEKLLRRGIIVRLLHSYGLPDHLRISIGNAEENQTLLRAIQDIRTP